MAGSTELCSHPERHGMSIGCILLLGKVGLEDRGAIGLFLACHNLVIVGIFCLLLVHFISEHLLTAHKPPQPMHGRS
jgi:hypothetical protein